MYFITICTQKKIPYFGFIERNKVFLSEVGILVQNLWIEIPNHFSNVILDEFIIMPDHIHGIIIIKSNGNPGVSNDPCKDKPCVSKGNPHWKSKSIGSIINQFKRICTIKTKSLKLDLVWQPHL